MTSSGEGVSPGVVDRTLCDDDDVPPVAPPRGGAALSMAGRWLGRSGAEEGVGGRMVLPVAVEVPVDWESAVAWETLSPALASGLSIVPG
jgi:hypothetical protein